MCCIWRAGVLANQKSAAAATIDVESDTMVLCDAVASPVDSESNMAVVADRSNWYGPEQGPALVAPPASSQSTQDYTSVAAASSGSRGDGQSGVGARRSLLAEHVERRRNAPY